MIRTTTSQANNQPQQTALQQLQQLQQQFQQLHLNQLFAQDPQRFQRFSVALDSVLFDYSKHRIDAKVLQTLVQFAQQSQLAEWIGRLFSTSTGSEKINYTEQRDAMHWALRLPAIRTPASSSEQTDTYATLTEQVHTQLERMYALVEKIHAGQYRGATGEVIQDVVNIGVGGSDLGPLMVTQALSGN